MPATLINTDTFALFDAARDCVVFWKSKHDELNVRAATAGICGGASRVPVTTEVLLTADDRDAILSACEASCWIDDTNQLEWRSITS
jgi:hypothetical protein